MDLGWFGVYFSYILCHYAANRFLVALLNTGSYLQTILIPLSTNIGMATWVYMSERIIKSAGLFTVSVNPALNFSKAILLALGVLRRLACPPESGLLALFGAGVTRE
jgi:hypothetical protein